MRLISSDPDVETIISRIQQNEIKLQPDFQRGEVWSDAKKRKLIDSILRQWHVPPIHVVEPTGGGIPEVLDGQQRLVAIRDFAAGAIKVDGRTEPIDPSILALHGLTYQQLPPEWKRRFNRFSIRVFNITDYRSEEPAELFFRLNQPVTLTSAEQRNAFFGTARAQVRDLVETLESFGAGRSFLGFSNSRMAYDDVVARFCATLTAGTLTAKITSNTLVSLYRADEGFPEEVLSLAETSISLFCSFRQRVPGRVHFNKATLFSWLWFTAAQASQERLDIEVLGDFLAFFEDRRAQSLEEVFDLSDVDARERAQERDLFGIYTDRATARVSDVSSVVARDIVIWILLSRYIEESAIVVSNEARFQNIRKARELTQDAFAQVDYLMSSGWGRLR